MTFDLHRRLDLGILKKSLVWMTENKDEIFADIIKNDESGKRLNGWNIRLSNTAKN